MIVEQIYTGCLAQGAYYIESNGIAAIIDPLREIHPYTQRAKQGNARIQYIFETHFHADFVSGHVDLAQETGAEIIFGPNAQTNYPCTIAEDNQVFQIGDVQIKVLHTPGHTLESSTYLLIDEQGKENCIFSGDTLFIGDVGRPDLAAKSNLTIQDLAALLYESLRNKIMTLPDDVIVYPAHGAGSACGKNMSKETFDSLGHQKEVNYALRANMTKEEFIQEVTHGLTPPPSYFPWNVQLNKSGYDAVNEVIHRGTTPLSANQFELLANETGAIILDTRNADDFSKGFIPGSIFIGIDGGFAPWVGTLITDIKQKILIVADPGREQEVVTRLARVGYDHALGFLEGGIQSWLNAGKELDQIERITAEEFALKSKNNGKFEVLDVRKTSEYEAEHLVHAASLPLDFINQNMSAIDARKNYIIHCAGGYRSMIFNSILRARGFRNLTDVIGGFAQIKKIDTLETTNFVCPSSKA